MKKFILFAAAMVFCAGLAFAQQPVKGNTNNASTNKEVKNDGKSGRGHCPHHAKCAKDDKTANNNKEVKEAKTNDNKGCCNKDDKQTPKGNKNENKTATKK